jgi:CPA2 family monovalent cation:H+ antiporter-2
LFLRVFNLKEIGEGMSEELKIIWILAIGFGLACLLGYSAHRMKLSPILGYVIAGYLIGPNFPGFVADPHLSEQLANIGVTLLMFAVGLNFKWNDLAAVKKIVLPGALILSLLSIGAGIFLSVYLGQTMQAGFVIGLAICVSSTVVIVRGLVDQNLLQTPQGHTVLGWTIVEDIISVLGLILLPTLVQSNLGGENSGVEFMYSLGTLILKIIALGVIIYYVGEKLVKEVLTVVARTRSHELFTLAILSCVFFIAIGSAYLFGVSLALGAFIAGTVVGKTEVSHQAAANALPMRDAFAVIFFLSVGMLFNPAVVKNNLPLFFGLLFIILALRPMMAFLIIKLAKYPQSIAISVAVAISQIGEYSFILAEEGNQLKILSDNAYDILVACAFISIMLNPLLFQLFRPLASQKTKKLFPENKEADQSLEALYKNADLQQSFLPRALVIGYGPVGRAVTHYLKESNFHPLVIDRNIDTVAAMKEKGIEAIFGDATQFQIMEKADLTNLQLMVVTTPDLHITQSIIQVAYHINPYIKIIARSHYKVDHQFLKFAEVPMVWDEEAAAEKMVSLLRTQLA